MIPPSGMPQTGFTTAPAGISPWLIYLERAMSTLRASATIEMRRIRPRSEPTRWRNQQLRALAGWYLTHIQASSIIVVRSRGFPCFRDALFVVDAATLPWTGSQAGIGRQLPSVLKVAEQTLKVGHHSEPRPSALGPHQLCGRRARLCQPQHFIAFSFDLADLA